MLTGSAADTYHQNDWRQNPLSGVKRVVWPYLVLSDAAIAEILQETARSLLRVWQAADVGLFERAASRDKRQLTATERNCVVHSEGISCTARTRTKPQRKNRKVLVTGDRMTP